jgi:hypothetical protein
MIKGRWQGRGLHALHSSLCNIWLAIEIAAGRIQRAECEMSWLSVLPALQIEKDKVEYCYEVVWTHTGRLLHQGKPRVA